MRIARRRLILLAVMVSVFVLALAVFQLLRGRRLFDPYSGKVVNLAVGVPAGVEARWRANISITRGPSSYTPLLRKPKSTLRRQKQEIVTRMISLGAEQDNRFMAVLVSRTYTDWREPTLEHTGGGGVRSSLANSGLTCGEFLVGFRHGKTFENRVH